MIFIGVDLAWAAPADRRANASGVVSLAEDGRIGAAGWTTGVPETVEWIEQAAGQGDAVVFVDAPLLVQNASGQRLCEKQVGQRYGRWKVSANSTTMGSPRLAGVILLQELERRGWRYDDGLDGPPSEGRVVSECYPYTTIVGVEELGYETERPLYKRKPKKMPVSVFRAIRAAACDELIERVAMLVRCDPALDLRSHPATTQLVEEPSPLDDDTAYKKREDLLDAAICAWTAALWVRCGETRCQVLGFERTRPAATIIAPARPEQRGEATNSATT